MTVALDIPPYLYKNEGPFTAEELRRLANSRVAVAGLGAYGAGALALAQLGIGTGERGCLRIADPDVYERHNANRQSEASLSNLGRNKTEVTAARILDLVPEVRVECFPEGVTLENMAAFLEDVDVVVDAIDFLRPDVKLAFHALARKQGLTVVTGLLVNKGAVGYVFTPQGPTFEEFFAFPQEARLKASWNLPGSRIMPHASHFPDGPGQSHRAALRANFEILTGQRHIPSSSLSANAFALLANHLTACRLLGKPTPEIPQVLCLDPTTFQMGVVDLAPAMEEHRRSIWTRIAPVYDRVLGHATVYTEVLERVAEDLGGCRRVLEAGVGTGMIAEYLARRGVEVSGIDLNLGMLAHAMWRSASLRATGAGVMRVGEGNVEDLFFADECFDGYCSNNVVFDADLEKAMREAYRVLAPGGRLVINSCSSVPQFDKIGGVESLVALGADPVDAREFIQCQIEMYEGRALRHGLRTHAVEKVGGLLLDVGFRDILRTESTYGGASFYLAARK